MCLVHGFCDVVQTDNIFAAYMNRNRTSLIRPLIKGDLRAIYRCTHTFEAVSFITDDKVLRVYHIENIRGVN